jgi:hypothetical protein
MVPRTVPLAIALHIGGEGGLKPVSPVMDSVIRQMTGNFTGDRWLEGHAHQAPARFHANIALDVSTHGQLSVRSTVLALYVLHLDHAPHRATIVLQLSARRNGYGKCRRCRQGEHAGHG